MLSFNIKEISEHLFIVLALQFVEATAILPYLYRIMLDSAKGGGFYAETLHSVNLLHPLNAALR